MLMLPPAVKIFLCAEATDMRRSFDRLAEDDALRCWRKTLAVGICSYSSTARETGLRSCLGSQRILSLL